ncbi:hypothetical protein EDB83DRAFT_2524198 [Lactarius deliciosus]|nr:hypothetical protein EDB83DRAFT_2524198 [Lactarius deliciosus]
MFTSTFTNAIDVIVRGRTPGVAFVPEMPEEFLEEDDVRAFGSMTQEHYDAWRHIEASFPST